MKSLPNSTNGVIVLSDSFATSIFKQSFLRVFNKDDQGNLAMGFNATFDVQVCMAIIKITRINILIPGTDHEGIESFRTHWTRDIDGQEICVCWRD
jgi:hypothetical protein